MCVDRGSQIGSIQRAMTAEKVDRGGVQGEKEETGQWGDRETKRSKDRDRERQRASVSFLSAGSSSR